ncbi:MAG: hypothetical protein Tsb0010_19200 [Parvularculaceae bacterium]
MSGKRTSIAAAGAAAIAGAAAGCASSGGDNVQTPPVPTTAASAEEAPRIGALDRARLGEAPCGIYLWTLSRDPELVFYATTDGAALMAIEGIDTEFARLREAGPTFFGQRTEQEFRASAPSGEMLTAEVTFEPGPRFAGGGYVQSGLIRLRAENGWERVTPVVGVAGCRE